jgi:hypothetical protein
MPFKGCRRKCKMKKFKVFATHYEGGTNDWEFDTREEAEKWAASFQYCTTSVEEVEEEM